MPLSYSQTYDFSLHLPGHALCLLHESLVQVIASRRLQRTKHSKTNFKRDSEEIATLQTILTPLEEFIRTGANDERLISQHYYGTLTPTFPPKNKQQLIAQWDANALFTLNLPQASVPVRRSDYAVGTHIRFKYKSPAVIINHTV